MKKIIFFVLSFFVFYSCAFAQLKAVSCSPSGALNEDLPSPQISVTFNKPVAALGAQNILGGGECPVEIVPAVEGQCRWAGTQTLVFVPAKPLASATKYMVTVKKGIKSAATGDILLDDFVWSFTTPLLRVKSAIPYDRESWVSPAPKIMVAFNLPVNIESFNKYTEIAEGNNRIAFRTLPITKELFDTYFQYSGVPASNIVMLEPLNPLEKGKKYTLTLKEGLKPLNGDIGMPQNYLSSFNTYGPLELIQTPENSCLPFAPFLIFSNPVKLENIYKNISFTPAINFEFSNGDYSGTPTYLHLEGDPDNVKRSCYNIALGELTFKPGQTYKVKINGDLEDIFGQKLGRDIEFEWGNDGYCPSLNFKGGFGVLESYLKPFHPVGVVNLKDIKLEKKKIDYNDFIPFYKQSENLHYGGKKFLEGSFTEKLWSPSSVSNEKLNTFIDLREELAPQKSGIVFTQILAPCEDEQGCWKRSFDVVTDIGLTIKNSPQDTLVWATYLKDGLPAQNKDVELRDRSNSIIWRGKTDENGLAMAPGWRQFGPQSEGVREVWAFVKDGDNIAVISDTFNDGIEPYRFNIYSDSFYSSQAPYKVFIFTDRGIYKTGEEVHIKAVIRKIKGNSFAYASDVSSADLIIKDSRGREVLSKTLNVDKNSAADYVYSIPSSASTGQYLVSLKIGKHSFFDDFNVEAVKPAEFKVQLNSLAKIYFAGGKADFGVNARYMFGAPLDGAEVKWNIDLYPLSYTPEGWKEYEFSDSFSAYGADRQRTDLLTRTLRLDDKGEGAISVDIPNIDYAASLSAQATVLSPQNQQLFARSSVEVLSADVFVGIKKPSYTTSAGKPFKVDIVVTDSQGVPLPAAEIEGKLVRREYLGARKTGLSGRLEWVNSQTITEMKKFTLSAADGKTQWAYTPSQTGEYYIILKSKDKQGRQNTSSTSFYVSGKGTVSWEQTEDDILQLVSDKKSYSPGETAKILIKSPLKDARALVTVEREGILYKQIIEVKDSARQIEIPVSEDFAPNVFVSVVLVQGRTGKNTFAKDGSDLAKPKAKFGYIALDVSPRAYKLDTQIKTDKTSYEPKQEVKLDIKVNNYEGKAEEATLSVFAVDEGMLALDRYNTPDIFGYFYSQAPLFVRTADNRLFLIGQRSFGEKGENRGGGGYESDAAPRGVDLRSDFRFTPFYAATVKTDKDGMAQLSFTLPDNLTKFRIMAVAAAEDKFGSAQTYIQVSKPVAIKPFLPRFARIGDTFDCGFTVYNYTEADNLETSFTSTLKGGIIFKENPRSKAVLGSGKSLTVRGKCFAKEMREAEFNFTAQNAQGSDGIQIKLPVLGLSAQQHFATSGATQKAESEAFQKPSDILADTPSSLEITLGSSAALNINSAAQYLAEYPYYCLEQRMSKLTPYIFGDNKGALDKETQESLNKVITYQAPSGGLAYWTNASAGDPYLTAYTLDILFSAKKAGYAVDKDMAGKALAWLNSYLSSAKFTTSYRYTSVENNIARAYAVYVLALYGHSNAGAYFSNMYSSRQNLCAEAEVYLLKAANILKLQSSYDVLKQDILNYAQISNTEMHFEAASNLWIYSDNIKITALALEGLLSGGGFEGDFKAAAWLNNSVKNSPSFGTTTDNALAFRALSAYVKAKESNTDFAASVLLNGVPFAKADFRGKNNPLRTFKESLTQLFGDKNIAKAYFSKKGEGTLYYKAALNYYARPSQEAQNAGFGVSKTIIPAGPLQEGQTVTVEITVSNDQERSFVVIDDALPAGFEVINKALATEDRSSSYDEYSEGSGSVHSDLVRSETYDDHIAAFVDLMPQGEYTFRYQARVIASGAFALPAATVSQMYAPDVWGRSRSEAALQVK